MWLHAHLTRLESALSEAAHAAMEAQPRDPLSQLASELAARANTKAGGGGGGARAGESARPAETAVAWAEEAARTELEEVLNGALEAAIDVMPAEPLSFVARHVMQMAAERRRRE